MAATSIACGSGTEQCHATGVNVGDTERNISIALGGLFVLCGLTKLSLSTIVTTVAGAALLYRGCSGHCGIYQALETSTVDEK